MNFGIEQRTRSKQSWIQDKYKARANNTSVCFIGNCPFEINVSKLVHVKHLTNIFDAKILADAILARARSKGTASILLIDNTNIQRMSTEEGDQPQGKPKRNKHYKTYNIHMRR